jgi:hypothetical protein
LAGRSQSLSILVAARDEADRIAALVERLRLEFPEAVVIVGDDGSRDGTAELARSAGAVVVSGPALGKGEALNAAEQAAPPGSLLLCDADVEGDLRPLVETGHDLAVAAFAERVGGGFGLAKGTARSLIERRCRLRMREPLSGQRYLNERARAACFPLARGFGCELRMTIDAARAGLDVGEVELPLSHRATGRDPAGFVHRGHQLGDAVLAAGPVAVNHRGNRLPIVGWAVAAGCLRAPAPVAVVAGAAATAGLVDDLFAGPERGWRGHLQSGHTTGVLKLVVVPLAGALATRSLSGGLVVGLAANALNQLDTKPGRALKAFLLTRLVIPDRTGGRFTGIAVLLLPYDLRERGMLGDAGSNALGAVVGLNLVVRNAGWRRWAILAGLAGLNALGDHVSLGALVERTPVLATLDRLGRIPT